MKGQEQRDQMQLCMAQARLDCFKRAIADALALLLPGARDKATFPSKRMTRPPLPMAADRKAVSRSLNLLFEKASNYNGAAAGGERRRQARIVDGYTMKKPSKTAAELEASIKVEMEDICDWPTDMAISVQPDGDSWKVAVVQEGTVEDAGRREMVEQIAARLKAEYDLKG
jgi:hypothetical protein